ncbi:hypothetical protein CHUAL_010380 [Chamberlinius hualienensis]
MASSNQNNCRSSKEHLDEDLEKAHFRRIVNAYKYYKKYSLQRVVKSESYLQSLPDHHRRLLANYEKHQQQVKVAIEHNYEMVKLIIKDVEALFENVKCEYGNENSNSVAIEIPSVMDMDKVQSTLKQFVRDWCAEGQEERNASYQPIIKELKDRFPATKRRLETVKVLVPGAGLGRLAYEIAKCGYSCQGNEFSLFMLFASNFVLNKCTETNLYTLYPWVHQTCNNLKAENQVKTVTFPDVDPSDIPRNSGFSMAAGDFLEIYTEFDHWDAVVTCFFLDTANNVVAYIETIWNILKPGGYWINLGPLLYHYADIPKENSIEPSYDQVVEIINAIGFEFEKNEINVPATYSHCPQSMLKYEYRCAFFVCKKPT